MRRNGPSFAVGILLALVIGTMALTILSRLRLSTPDVSWAEARRSNSDRLLGKARTFVERGSLLGLGREEVIVLLGQPDHTNAPPSRYSLEWRVGKRRLLWSVDLYLVASLNASNVVSETFIRNSD